jgi:hypothetical protein
MDSLKEEVRDILDSISKMTNSYEFHNCNYTPSNSKNLNRFLKREKIIEFLLRFGFTEHILKNITNYKQSLENYLRNLNYKPPFKILDVQKFLEEKNIPEMNNEQEEIKLRILRVIQKRQEDYENRKSPKLVICESEDPIMDEDI